MAAIFKWIWHSTIVLLRLPYIYNFLHTSISRAQQTHKDAVLRICPPLCSNESYRQYRIMNLKLLKHLQTNMGIAHRMVEVLIHNLGTPYIHIWTATKWKYLFRLNFLSQERSIKSSYFTYASKVPLSSPSKTN